MATPDFFIIGAPKCGTTSLASWLGAHPDIFMSAPKEPNFFSTDFNLPSRPKTIEAYEKLFNGTDHLTRRGEASTSYLVSDIAVPKILNYQPDAYFIVCLRNPINMVCSLHAQRLKEGMESVLDCEHAWMLQENRLAGKNIPFNCPDRKLLQYGWFCSLGAQVERLLSYVPRNRVIFFLLDDMKEKPKSVYDKTLCFLGVDSDSRVFFKAENIGSTPRNTLISQLSYSLGKLKHLLGIQRDFGVQSKINTINSRSTIAGISNEFNSYLKDYFSKDIALLAHLIERDVSHWLS